MYLRINYLSFEVFKIYTKRTAKKTYYIFVHDNNNNKNDHVFKLKHWL